MKNDTGNHMFSFSFLPGALWDLADRYILWKTVHQLKFISVFVTSVQISQTIHQLKLHVCAKYLETLRFDMIPNRISTSFHLATDELRTLC